MLKNAKRTHGCGSLRLENVGETTLLQGWIHAYRDLGGLVFLTLRDRTGLCQITVDERCAQPLRDQGAKLRQEYVVEIEGTINKRPNANPKLPTGMIEVVPTAIRLLSTTLPLPFTIDTAKDAHEETRLKYRYLDLRRPRLQNNLRVRHKAAQAVRRYVEHFSL